MEPSLTERLCTRCALCCDGSLFADVEVAGRREAARLEGLGLLIEDGEGPGGILEQPCAALVGRRCGIYKSRPECCRTFECGLLQAVRRGAVSVESAEGHIARARGLVRRAEAMLVRLERYNARLPLTERVAEALTGDADGAPKVKRQREQLAAGMSSLASLIRTVFLRG